MQVSDQVWDRRQRSERGPVGCRALGDDLPVGAVHLAAADRQPRGERGVHLRQRRKRPAGRARAPGRSPPAAPPGPCRSGGRRPARRSRTRNGSERRRLRVQRHRLARRDMAADHGLGPVVNQRPWHPAEMRERPPVAVEEGAQLHAVGVTAERVPRVRQHHVERVGLGYPGMRQDAALLTPVDLRLNARQHLEPAVQPAQRVLITGFELGGDPRPGPGHIHLHPLVGVAEPVLGHQPLMDHRCPHRDVSAQPRVDHPGERGDHLRQAAPARRPRRRHACRARTDVLLHRPPVTAHLGSDLGIGSAPLVQGTETTNVHPRLRIQDHGAADPSEMSSWRLTLRRVALLHGRNLHFRPKPSQRVMSYAHLHVTLYADTAGLDPGSEEDAVALLGAAVP